MPIYHNGKGAINKLLAETKTFKESEEKGELKTQVAWAFYRKELNDINLVRGGGFQQELQTHHRAQNARFTVQGLSEVKIKKFIAIKPTNRRNKKHLEAM